MDERLWDPWPMRVITKPEAMWCYEQRRLMRSGKSIAAELGKAKRSVERAISYISLERGTYDYEAWRRKISDHKSARGRWFYTRCSERDRQARIAAQSAKEHLAMVELATRAALDPKAPKTPQKTLNTLYMSGTVPIVTANGDAQGEQRGAAASARPVSAREKAARARAKRLREMLGPDAMPHELGL
jgi:hypothetical protein